MLSFWYLSISSGNLLITVSTTLACWDGRLVEMWAVGLGWGSAYFPWPLAPTSGSMPAKAQKGENPLACIHRVPPGAPYSMAVLLMGLLIHKVCYFAHSDSFSSC